MRTLFYFILFSYHSKRMTRPGMAEAVRHGLIHAICGRARLRPAVYSPPIGGRLDTSASRWREHRACSVWVS